VRLGEHDPDEAEHGALVREEFGTRWDAVNELEALMDAVAGRPAYASCRREAGSHEFATLAGAHTMAEHCPP
jgi:hypothetical protein